jgi:hypothetical protein
MLLTSNLLHSTFFLAACHDPRTVTLPLGTAPRTVTLLLGTGPRTVTLPLGTGPRTVTLPLGTAPRTVTLPLGTAYSAEGFSHILQVLGVFAVALSRYAPYKLQEVRERPALASSAWGSIRVSSRRNGALAVNRIAF